MFKYYGLIMKNTWFIHGFIIYYKWTRKSVFLLGGNMAKEPKVEKTSKKNEKKKVEKKKTVKKEVNKAPKETNKLKLILNKNTNMAKDLNMTSVK